MTSPFEPRRPPTRALRAARRAWRDVRGAAPAVILICVGTMTVVGVALDEPISLMMSLGVGCPVLALALGWAERFLTELVFPLSPPDDTPPSLRRHHTPSGR